MSKHLCIVCMQGQEVKRTSDPMELDLQVVVNCLMWILGLKPGLHIFNPPLID